MKTANFKKLSLTQTKKIKGGFDDAMPKDNYDCPGCNIDSRLGNKTRL